MAVSAAASGSRLTPALRDFAQAAANAVIAIGALVLAGWLFDLPRLKSILPGLVTMKVNTALCLMLAGLSLRVLVAGERGTTGGAARRGWRALREAVGARSSGIATACAAVAGLVGLLTLGQYLFGWDLGIDQLLVREGAGAVGTPWPGRMAPATALALVLLSGALLLLHRDRLPRPARQRLAQALALLAAAIGLLGIIGYAYRIRALYSLPGTTQMAIHSALTLTLLALGVLAARPDGGLVAAVTGDSAGAVLARRLLPAAIGVPLVLGWLSLEGARAGLYSSETSFALTVLSSVAIFALLLWRAGRTLHWGHMGPVPPGALARVPALAAPGQANGWETVAARVSGEELAGWVQHLEQLNREMRLLTDLDEMLQAGLNLEEAYGVISRSGPQLFPGLSGILAIRDAEEPLLEAAATWGEVSGAEPLFGVSDCWALRRGRAHPGLAYRAGLVCRHLREPLPADSLCVPLLSHGEVLGVLTLQSWSPGAPITDAQAQLAATVAEHIALALANLRAREALRSQAIRDDLTGLFNRRYMEETLERELSRAARYGSALGVIMLDLDHFKRFNDSFGHIAGDALLRSLGAFLGTHLRREDIACRYGGEEFLLILPGSSLENARRRAEQLQDLLKQLRIEHRGRPLGTLTVSLGVAAYPEHGATRDALVQAADTALYRAKAAGRDQVAVAD